MTPQMRNLIFAALMLVTAVAHAAEERILWFSLEGGGLQNTTTLQNAINFAVNNKFNAICVLARYRANAYYIPNRDKATYPNPEPRASGAAGDTLQYVIDHGHEAGLRVYASFSTFLVTDGSAAYPSFLDPNWKTWFYVSSNSSTYSPLAGYPRVMAWDDPSAEGIWLDPGIAAVRAYIRNVLKDLVRNYDIDGVILDRIRYPKDQFTRTNGAYGYNPTALAEMGISNPPAGSGTFWNAKRNAITMFLNEAGADVRSIRPWVIFGATPVIFSTNMDATNPPRGSQCDVH